MNAIEELDPRLAIEMSDTATPQSPAARYWSKRLMESTARLRAEVRERERKAFVEGACTEEFPGWGSFRETPKHRRRRLAKIEAERRYP